jgi:hypothetical protein
MATKFSTEIKFVQVLPVVEQVVPVRLAPGGQVAAFAHYDFPFPDRKCQNIRFLTEAIYCTLTDYGYCVHFVTIRCEPVVILN